MGAAGDADHRLDVTARPRRVGRVFIEREMSAFEVPKADMRLSLRNFAL
jgi:hypothetical protein